MGQRRASPGARALSPEFASRGRRGPVRKQPLAKEDIVKQCLLAASVVLAASFLCGCSPTPQSEAEPVATEAAVAARDGVPADHPELDQQEMYIACSDCHRDVQPELVEQWWTSSHGVGNVKCYQCHGTYENMMRVPAESNCAICHEAQVSADDHTAGMACWQCHPAHGFTVHTEGGER